MANGMWQFVVPDADLHPVALSDVLAQVRVFTSEPYAMQGDYLNDVESLSGYAERWFGVAREQLYAYYYCTDDGVISVILAAQELDVLALKQPWRYSWDMVVDPDTGLITRGGVVVRQRSLFQKAAVG